jgi:transcriptional regulator with XRE-family HTH domain
MKPLADLLQEKGLEMSQLVEASGLETRVVKLLLAGSYTPSPGERKRIAEALDVPVEDIAWGHTIPVQYLRGNGPQSGRST